MDQSPFPGQYGLLFWGKSLSPFSLQEFYKLWNTVIYREGLHSPQKDAILTRVARRPLSLSSLCAIVPYPYFFFSLKTMKEKTFLIPNSR